MANDIKKHDYNDSSIAPSRIMDETSSAIS
jgi:hypothetical protein